MKKTNLLVGLSALALSVFASGCGGGKVVVTTHPAIIVYGGYYGYYSNAVFCDWVNNYCGTGVAYGIYDDGLYYNGVYYTNYGSSGGSSGGSTGSTGSSGSSGSSGIYSGSSGGSSGSSGSGGFSGGSSGYAVTDATRDVLSMRADFQMAKFDGAAQQLAATYSLNIDAARQLVQLSDKMTALQAKAGGMTAEDQAAITDAALGVAGITSDEVNTATTAAIQNKDMTGVNALLAKGAANTGTTVTVLRDQILPSLGLNLGSLTQ